MSIFIQNSNISPSPWQSRQCEKGSSYEIVDNTGKVLARVPHIPAYTSEMEFLATLSVMTAAPELLAALREAAYHLDNAGVPLRPEFYELINRASSTMLPIAGPRNTPAES